MNVKFSCVVDQHPKFGRQAIVWASSLLIYGGAEVDSLVIHTVGEYDSEYKAIFHNWGIETQVVQGFDQRHPNSNKLAQLETNSLHNADFVILCDCDVAFCSAVSSWVSGEAIRARIGSYAGLPSSRWGQLFCSAELPLPIARANALLDEAETLPSYCNGGLYIIPQNLFQRLRVVWPKWDRWLLDQPVRSICGSDRICHEL
jgi:hypothetical protein